MIQNANFIMLDKGSHYFVKIICWKQKSTYTSKKAREAIKANILLSDKPEGALTGPKCSKSSVLNTHLLHVMGTLEMELPGLR